MPGRHRHPRRRSRLLLAIAATMALIVGVSAGIYAVYRFAGQAGGCKGSTKLNVAAAPEIAPSVKKAAESVKCVDVEVSAIEPADMAAAIAGRQGVTLAGVGQPSGEIPLPDVWVPDSSTWLARLARAMPDLAGADAPSIARSPVVIAMPEPVAQTLGWPNAKLTWQALLQQVSTNSKLHIGTVEPTRDAAALSGLLALGGAANATAGQAAATGALRTLATGRSQVKQDLLARFPRSTDPAAIASGLSAAALSEQTVIAYNARKPPVKLAALYLEPAPVALDYPFAVLPGGNLERGDAAAELRKVLGQSVFLDKLAADGLRAPDGAAGQAFPTPAGAAKPTASPLPNAGQRTAIAAAVDQALSTWIAVTLPARMLAVIDVSGSMLQRVPTAGNATRAQVTLEAARRGLGLFDDSWAVGLWTFSTNLNGNIDYQEQAPIGPLASQRTQLLAKLGAVQPIPQGDTGLYDTLFAAYQAVQKDWDPGRINSVVMMTDGDNDDPTGGLSHEQLLAKLKEVADPKKPIQVIIIGIGPTVNPGPLEQVTKQTGGGVFVAEDPAKIGEIFLKAISLRAGQ